jgi:uncharacterized membrane protein
MAAPRARRGYLDWLRGVAVLIMIQAHVIDSWTAGPSRGSPEFGWTLIVGGMGAPLFLFLAGISVALSTASKARRSDVPSAAKAVARRGLEIFGLAFLFRLQSWVLSGGPARMLLRVDILNIMGPSIAAAAVVWGLLRSTRARFVGFAAIALAIGLLTPPVRAAGGLAVLPDPLEAYIRPFPVLSNFVVFPWAGFLFAGAAVGVLIETQTTRSAESRLQAALALAGASLVAGAYAGSHLPSVYSGSSFWTSSPSYFGIRTGILVLAVAAAYGWERRAERQRWSPLQQMGRTSLFIYWIHVEMVYGDMSASLHRALSLGQAWAGFAVFTLLMLGVSMAKDRIVGGYRARSVERR